MPELCDCELRNRKWNGLGKCLFCGCRYVATPTVDVSATVESHLGAAADLLMEVSKPPSDKPTGKSTLREDIEQIISDYSHCDDLILTGMRSRMQRALDRDELTTSLASEKHRP